jgi:branched-chain amino acid transport system permease protein
MNFAFFANLVVNGIIEGLIVALAALALNLVFAVARFPNAATGDMMTVGAYAGIATQSLGIRLLWVQLGSAVIACMALGAIFYFLVFRRLQGQSMLAPLLASIGLAFFIRSVIFLVAGPEQYVFQMPIRRGYMIGGVSLQPNTLWLSAIVLATLCIAFAVLFLTPVGRRMRAVSDNMMLARASGIPVDRVMLMLWLLVGAVTGIAGMVLGVYTVVMPENGWNILLPAFSAAVLGGVGSPTGAVVAGLLIGIVQEVSTPFVGFTYKIALSFIALIAILTVRPRGLFGSAVRVR